MRRNLLGPAALGLVVTGGVALWGLRREWSTATVRTPGLPSVDLAVTGSDVVPGAVGLAIVVIAAAAGVLAAGPRLRRWIGALVVLAAAGGAVLSAGSARRLDGARRSALRDSVTPDAAVTWSSGPWPWVAAGAFAAAALVGLLTAWRGPSWPTMGRRYEAPAAREPDASDLWKSMDDGVDPTA